MRVREREKPGPKREGEDERFREKNRVKNEGGRKSAKTNKSKNFHWNQKAGRKAVLEFNPDEFPRYLNCTGI